jgi:hypothetical protein
MIPTEERLQVTIDFANHLIKQNPSLTFDQALKLIEMDWNAQGFDNICNQIADLHSILSKFNN